MTLGFAAGALACLPDCSGFDTRGCTNDLCSGVTCTALDQCHDVGVCNPDTGACSSPPKLDGTACNDGNACTQADTCQAGACVGGAPVTCPPQLCRTDGICNPQTGQCQYTFVPLGQDPNNDCPQEPGAPGHCDGAGACAQV